MPSIEINTSQNVPIEYELASLRDRILAFLIDSVIIWGSILILGGLGTLAFGVEASQYIIYLVLAPIFLFYTLLLEVFNEGQSWGKKALSIQVVKLNGHELSFNDFLIRWVFRMVDIYMALGAIATLLVSSSPRNQRLGDVLAGTSIIKSKPSLVLRLGSITKMNSIENYKVTYPEVRKYTEEEMLLVKKVIDRSKKYPNKAHQEQLNSLADILCTELGLSKKPVNKQEFLRKLLQDYIVLTR